MRFPVFSGDHFMPQAPRFYGCGGSRGQRGCSGSTRGPRGSPFSPWDATPAAFIPVMMMGPRCRGDPRQQRSAPPSSSQMPGFCGSAGIPSQPDIDEALNMAQDLLGKFLGQSTGAKANTAKKGQSTNKPSSPSASRENRSDKTPSAPRTSARSPGSGASDTTRKPPHSEKTASGNPSAFTQSTMSETATEKPEDSRYGETGDPKIWSHSLSLAGLAPTKISVKAKDGEVHVLAVSEKVYGPGACLCKLETTQVIKLPENIDQKTLTCLTKQNNTLLLQARFKDNIDEKKAHADKREGAEIPNKAVEKTLPPSDQGEDAFGSAEEKTVAENQETLETKADRMDVTDNAPQTVLALQTKAGASENNTEQTKTGPETIESLPERSDKEDENPTDEISEELTTENPETDHPTGEEEDTDFEELEKQTAPEAEASDVEDGDKNQTTQDTSFPIIEEPDDESFSRTEHLLENDSISSHSSAEEFVILSEDSTTNSEVTNTETGNGDSTNNKGMITDWEHVTNEKEQVDKEHKEEENGREIHASDETDPTRPIKRNGVQDSSFTPDEQSQKDSCESTPNPSSANQGAFRGSMTLVGFDPQDVHVNLQGHRLHIVAKRQAWMGEVSYTESVDRELELPGHVDVMTVRCVYQQDNGCLVITADPPCLGQQRQVPVVLQ